MSTNVEMGVWDVAANNLCVAPENEEGQPYGRGVVPGKAGMKPHGLRAQRQRGLTIAEIGTTHRRVDQHVRVVRIEAEGPVNVKRGFIEAPPIQQNPPQHHLDHRVGIVQGRRATGVVYARRSVSSHFCHA